MKYEIKNRKNRKKTEKLNMKVRYNIFDFSYAFKIKMLLFQ